MEVLAAVITKTIQQSKVWTMRSLPLSYGIFFEACVIKF